MVNNAVHKNIIALIPARGGSQRVKNKNIRQLSNKPLIGYTIESALKAKNIDRVIVSTDNHEIAKIALEYGAEVPFLRPEKFATADSTEFDFHNHTLQSLEKLDQHSHSNNVATFSQRVYKAPYHHDPCGSPRGLQS